MEMEEQFGGGAGSGAGDVAAAKIPHRSMYESWLFHECRRRRN